MKIKELFRGKEERKEEPASSELEPQQKTTILQEDQQERMLHDMSILDDDGRSRGERLQKEAEREVKTAAEDSLRRLHVIQRGRCPKCGEHLHKHLFASVCDACGWHTFDAPRNGPVRVHLANSQDVVEGERCYVVKTGAVLLLKKDVVVARIPASAVGWIEYVWHDDEISQRHKQVIDQVEILCGWCNEVADAEKDGFHLIHVAFGGTQERFCLCSDECYEAFRKMYPARVHRNCYERTCADCDLCVKRYTDEEDGVHILAKDFLHMEPGKSKSKSPGRK